jgi:hypothetical protein
MAKPVEAVERQVRAWRESPAQAPRALEFCARAFAQCALGVEEMLQALEPQPRAEAVSPEAPERQWRWKRKGYVLFWAATAALSLLAFAAGYLAARG